MSILRLAVPTPLRRPFDYLPPHGLEPDAVAALQPGVRLRVPFGRREVTAWLLEVCSDSEVDRAALKPALALLDPVPLLPPSLFQLLRWAADYYLHAPGEVALAGFPRRLREGAAHQPLGEPGWRLSERGRGLPEGALARAPKQAAALASLQAADTVPVESLRQQGLSSAILKALADKGLAEPCLLAPAAREPRCHASLPLNPEQQAAFDAIDAAAGQFSCHLLEGVTGSGKTEVYLQLIAACLARRQQALVLIPEIGLTPQTVGRFEARFDATIAVLHSGLSDSERYRAWEAARDGSAHIVIGTRSAVFTPLPSTGLIIVDEEHDQSFKQQDGFRYSARDVAVKRAQLERCPVLLGSATPSLESIHNAASGRYGHHRLRQRAGDASLPELRLLDIRRQDLQGGLSPALLQALDQTLARGEQALLFLNRRGFAPSLQCHDCGWLAECRHCDARLTVHRRRRQLRCHHCGAGQALPVQCPECRSSSLLTAGLGTEQAEERLRQRYSSWPVHRVDSDSMQSRRAMAELVTDINRGEPCILLGTQMLTKGHHFPGVSLVAVIDADGMLFSADFRGEERMAQLLTQVAGRAGREGLEGQVLVQTHYPDHPALIALVAQDYADRARALLAQRRAAGLPPAGHMLLLRCDCRDARAAEQFLGALRGCLESQLPAGCLAIGPLPSPLPRRAGQYRFQLTLTAPDRAAARSLACRAVAAGEALPKSKGLNWSIDIDPQDVY